MWTSKWKKKKERRKVPKFIVLSAAAVLVVSLFHTWTMLKGPCQQTAAMGYVGGAMPADRSYGLCWRGHASRPQPAECSKHLAKLRKRVQRARQSGVKAREK